MKLHTYLLFILFLLMATACSEQTAIESGIGYLYIEDISFTGDTEKIPVTRAVDAGLKLEIWQGSETVRTYDPGSEELSKRIVLPVGEYVLKAFTPNQQEPSDDNEAGIPVYSVEQSFSIKEGLTRVSVVAPQVNVGVSVEYSEEFMANFHDYIVIINSPTGRQVSIMGNDTALRYFNYPDAGGQLIYTLTATNADGETMTSEARPILQESGAELTSGNYKVRIGLVQ